MNRQRFLRQTLRLIVIYAASFVVLAWVLAPIYWVFVSSISTRIELYARPHKHWIPEQPTLQNYVDIFTTGQRFREGASLPTAELLKAGLRNTLAVSTITALVVTALATVAGHVFARLRFRGKTALFFYIVLMMPLPVWVSLISLFFLMSKLNLLDNNLGIMVVLTTLLLPLQLWLMTTFARDVPFEVEEAALIDGANRWQILWHVVFPLARPGMTSVFLVTFLSAWNAFLIPLIFTNTARSQSVTVVLSLFIGQYEVAWEAMSAATVLVMLPPILMALFLQRYLVRGLSLGALKG
jgi:multiple sugar transport system permease protein